MTVGVANQRQHILSLLNYLGIWFSASGQVTRGARARAEPEAVGPEGVGSLAGPRGAPIVKFETREVPADRASPISSDVFPYRQQTGVALYRPRVPA